MFAASKTDSASTGDYQISRSLRFNSADSAYLGRTFGTPTNANVWTFSCWIKRSALSVFSTIIGRDGTLYPIYQFNTTNTFGVYDSGSTSTAAVFRDPSAWYHLVIQRTDSTTVTVYFNGVSQLTATGQTNAFNLSGQTYTIGKNNTGEYFDGYMTEVNFIDGQALTPSSFGETNAQTGVWQPKAFSGGAYGTNGFYLNFSDNSNITAATLGKDYSGNGNNWTPNNFSVSAGAGNDSLVDVPTPYGLDTGVGGNVRGNYCTLNPLGTAGAIPTNGNLSISNSSTIGNRISTFLLTSGKWYWEAMGEGYVGTIIGVDGTQYTGSVSGTGSKSIGYWFYGPAYWDGGSQSGGPTYTSSDVIGVALDMDIGNVKFYKNNTLIYDLTFGSGTIPNLSSGVFAGYNIGGGTYSVDFNFGQRPFVYTAPSNFKAICTQNLPTPTIGATTATQAGKFFNSVIYTGAGGSQSITGVGFQPDWVWMKSRSNGSTNNILQNAVTGVTKGLQSNVQDAEFTDATTLTAFNSDGFTVGGNSQTNLSTYTYVAWNWKASNATAVTNTSGSITSTVSANTTSGFSVVTYTGVAADSTVGHGLGVAPSMIIAKSRTNAGTNWVVYHAALGINKTMIFTSSGEISITGYWGTSNPTSTVFGVKNAYDNNSGNMVAYCFAPIAGYSAFGSYTGNGSATGPFIYTGFRPAFVLIKNTTSTGPQWWILDNKRNVYNPEDLALPTSLALAEQTIATCLNFLSNGFQITTTNGDFNTSGSNYIFMAIAENPFKYSLAR